MFRHITALLWNTRRSGVLLAAQILLAFIVLFAIFSFSVASFTDYSESLGFRVEDTYLVNVDLPTDFDTTAYAKTFERLQSEIGGLNGVIGVSRTGWVTPFGETNMGYGNDQSGVFIFTRLYLADEDLGEVLEVPMARGRWYTPADTIGGRSPMVVNEAFVRSNFPGGDLVDSSFQMFDTEVTVVGVAKNFKYRREFEDEEALVIRYKNPYSGSNDFPYTALLIHVEPDAPQSLEQEIFERVSEVTKSRSSVVSALDPIRQRTSRSSWVPLVILLSICAFLVANVALGLFGILINAIAKRRGEIGLRKAMGATGGNIAAQFTLEVVLIALLGIALGGVVAVQVPMFELIELETEYFWWGAVLAAALILTIVVLCALIPSGQAARIHPAVALRED